MNSGIIPDLYVIVSDSFSARKLSKGQSLTGGMSLIFLFLINVFFIRNHFISNLVLDSLKFKKPLELQGRAKKL